MKKAAILIFAAAIFSACKKDKKTLLPTKEKCKSENYAGLYRSVKFERANIPFSDTMRLFLKNDSVFTEFPRETVLNGHPTYYTGLITCEMSTLKCVYSNMENILVMKDTVISYMHNMLTGDTLYIKYYVKIK